MLIFAHLILAATHVLIPAGLILWLWGRASNHQLDWIIRLLIVGCYVLWIFMSGRWDFLSYYVRYLLLILFALAALASFLSVRPVPFFTHQNFLWWASLGARSLVLLLFAALVLLTFRARRDDRPAVALGYPLSDGTYYVAHGGSNMTLNHHAAAPPQKYALDITALDKLGRRAAGVLPRDLEQYVIFGEMVYSPCDGEVVAASDGLPDQTPPEADPTQPAGNHLWVRQTDVYILLAHLMKGSIMVKEGERVRRGQPLARVGNSGNTSEPHLHIHAVRFDGTPSTDSQFLLREGRAVPMLFDGRFLTRNTTFNARGKV